MGNALEHALIVRGDARACVAGVDAVFEELDLLARVLRAAHAADQLLGLAREHASADDLDPADVLGYVVHGCGLRGAMIDSTAAEGKL